MTERHFLEHGPGNSKKILELEDGKGRVTIIQDDTHFLEQNKQRVNAWNRSDKMTKWAMPIMSIPYIRFLELVQQNPELTCGVPDIENAALMRIAREREDLRVVPKNYVPSGKRFDLE